MHVRNPYRFNRIVPMFIAMLIFFVSANIAHAQVETDTVEEAVAPPVEEYDEEDEYSNLGEELPPELREVADSTVNRLKSDEDFEYANDEEYLQTDRERRRRSSAQSGSGNTATTRKSDPWQGFYNFFGNTAVKVIFYILLAAFFLWVIYRIIVVNNLYFYRSGKKALADDEPSEEEINDDTIDEKIRKAVNARDYRSAVRYLYLKGLRLLNDKGWIRYHAQATNHDYVYQVSQYPVAGNFRFLTRVYDYVWYGEFVVNDEQFAQLQTNFQQFYQDLKK